MDILVADFVKGVLIALRIAGVLFTAPIFNLKAIPVRAKLLLTIILAYISLYMVPDIDPAVAENFLLLFIYGVKEVLTGMIIGFAINFIFYGISFAGLILGYEMGLFIAQMFDPTTESNNNVVGQALLIIGILIFIVINGHHYIIHAIAYSFKVLPIGIYAMNDSVEKILVQYSSAIFMLAIKIASPIMISFFLLDIGAGIIARVIPQMNVFFVVQPLKIELGMVLLVFVIPVYVYVIKDILMNYETKILELIQKMGF
jgi:flagellar biosynthetic protein FliR